MLRIALRALAVLAALALPALTLLACVQRPPMVIETSSGDVVPLESWTAALSAPASDMRGTARLEPGASIRETRASLTIAGAEPLSVHAWFVHLGECNGDRGILASTMAYAPIMVDGYGEGTSVVTLPFTVPISGRYSVSVQASESETSRTVACGNLTKGRLVGGPTIAEARGP